jgi:hypothetical protein
MPFVFGETPAQAARMGYGMASANRAAQQRTNELQAGYDFRTNSEENANALRYAAMLNQRQQEENALGRESESLGMQRYQLGQQAEAAKRAEDWQKYTFGQQLGQANKEFDFRKAQVDEQKGLREDELSNAGNALAGALADLKPQRDAALYQKQQAEEKLAALHANAQKEGLLLDPRGRKYTGTSPLTQNFNQRLEDYNFDRDAANNALKPILSEANALERQARGSGFVVEQAGVRHQKRGTFFPYAQPAAQAQEQAAPSAPQIPGVPPVVATYNPASGDYSRGAAPTRIVANTNWGGAGGAGGAPAASEDVTDERGPSLSPPALPPPARPRTLPPVTLAPPPQPTGFAPWTQNVGRGALRLVKNVGVGAVRNIPSWSEIVQTYHNIDNQAADWWKKYPPGTPEALAEEEYRTEQERNVRPYRFNPSYY